jgi:subtilisin family serine protease
VHLSASSAIRFRSVAAVAVAAIAFGLTTVVPARAETPMAPTDVAPAELPLAPEPAPQPADGPTTVSAIVVVDGEAEVVTRAAAPAEVAAVTEELEQLPGVVDVSVDVPVSVLGTDPHRGYQWALDDMRLGALPADAADGSGQLVAVLDTGVLATHEDLAGRVRCDLGADFAPDAGDYPGTSGCVDPHGHGTHVAGQISAVSGNGLGIAGASSAEIMPVRVLGATGSGDSAGIANGIIWAVDHGADVINMSLGGPYTSQYDVAVAYATDRDVVVVAAAGNNRQDGNTPNYPGATPGAIGVAASDEARQSASFSYSGPTNWISAPGTMNLSTDISGGYVYRQGTSMAAPHVAAVLARHRDAFPANTAAQIREVVRTTAIDLETPGFDANTGYGLLNAHALITDAAVSGAPHAPGPATATPGDGAATVSWTAPADGGSAITGYAVTASPGGRTCATTGATSCVVTGLTNGTAHTFTVRATNATGTGPASAPSAAVTPMGAVQRYVSSVYADLLKRTPDSGGLVHWSGQLQAGIPYETVANAITASPEFRSRLITSAYARYLSRTPDAEGLQSWLASMTGGLHIEQMEAGFVVSPEFYTRAGGTDRAWVSSLYSTVLSRPASAADLDHWVGRLRTGASRWDVAIGFLYSTEHLTAVVDGYYHAFLRRGIDPEGAHTWVTLIQRGVRDEQIIAGLITSAEYRSRA